MVFLPQMEECSSLLSPQSSSPSHTQPWGIHLLLPHLNWKCSHCLFSQFSSSELSPQSSWRSHTLKAYVQFLFLHWNWPGAQWLAAEYRKTTLITIIFSIIFFLFEKMAIYHLNKMNMSLNNLRKIQTTNVHAYHINGFLSKCWFCENKLKWKTFSCKLIVFLFSSIQKLQKIWLPNTYCGNKMQNLHLKKIPIAHHINCITKIGLNKSKL